MGLNPEEMIALRDMLFNLKDSATLASCSKECPSLKSIIFLMERSGLDAMEASMLLRLMHKFEATKK